MRYGGSSSTPKACSLKLWGARAISSTPQACGLVFHHPRRGAHGAGCLPGWRSALELVAEILEVVLADTQFPHFLDHGKEIGQRANGA